MNIIQIQNQLKGLPDNVIAGYVQNPSGQVPAYLALSELQRRKTTREEFQKNQQAPQQSVAESLVGQQAPQPQQMPPQQPQGQGIGALPQGQPQQQQGFAQGGIVGYADGGDVLGELKAEADDTFEKGDYEQAKALYAQLANIQEQQTSGGISNVPQDMPEPQIEQARAQINDTLMQSKALPRETYTPDENLPVANIPDSMTGLPALTPEPSGRDFYKPVTDIGQPEVPMATQAGIASLAPQVELQNQLIEKSKERQDEDRKGRVKDYTESAKKDNEKTRASKAARGIEELPVENIPDRVEPPPLVPTPEAQNMPQTTQVAPLAKGVKTGLESLVPQKELTPLEAARKEYEASLAPDQETRENIQRRMKHLDKQAKWRDEHTDFDALTKAGLAMMAAGSKSGATFLGSAAAGGEAGIKSLAEARKDQYETEEKRADLELKLTQLERAERIAAKKYGLDSAEFDAARENTKEVAKEKVKTDRELQQMKEEGDTARAKMMAEAHIKSAGIHAGAAKTSAERKPELIQVAERLMAEAQGAGKPITFDTAYGMASGLRKPEAGMSKSALLKEYNDAMESWRSSKGKKPTMEEWARDMMSTEDYIKMFPPKNIRSDVADKMSKYPATK